jgi:hypothetical protein
MFNVVSFDNDGIPHYLNSFETEEEALTTYAAYEAMYGNETNVDIISIP